MSIMNDIIRERRKELGLTQKELADILSISDKTVSRWESGNQIPDAILLPDLAEALKISINDLYGIAEKDDKPASNSIISKTPHKHSGALNLAYKICMALGLVLFLFGSMLMVHINAVYWMSTDNEWQNGNVFIYLGAGLCVMSQVAFMIINRQKAFASPAIIKI